MHFESANISIYMNSKLSSLKCVQQMVELIHGLFKMKMMLKFFPAKQRNCISLVIKFIIVLVESIIRQILLSHTPPKKSQTQETLIDFFCLKPTFRRRSSPLRRRPVRGRGGWRSTGRRRGDSPGVTQVKKTIFWKIKILFYRKAFLAPLLPRSSPRRSGWRRWRWQSPERKENQRKFQLCVTHLLYCAGCM